MSTQTELAPVDLSKYAFAPDCDVCGDPATVIAKGCRDKQPVLMCNKCLDRGLEAINTFIHVWMRCNKRVFICGDCYRPVLNLDTHLEVKRLRP